MTEGQPDERLLLQDALLLVAHGLPLVGALPSELEQIQPSPRPRQTARPSEVSTKPSLAA